MFSGSVTSQKHSTYLRFSVTPLLCNSESTDNMLY